MSNQVQFQLVVRTAAGAVQTLNVAAHDAGAARAAAARDGLQVLGCSERSGMARTRAADNGGRRLGLDIANFSFELASLMAAGLSVADALRTLAAKEPPGARRNALLDVAEGINEGQPLSAALERHPGRYPALLVATVQASEQTGDLSTSLLRYAEHQQVVKSLRDKVVGAAIYPLLLLAVGCVVIVFLVAVVVPKFATLIESTRHALPWSSAMLMAWGRFAAQHGWELAVTAVVVLALVVGFVRQLIRSGGKAAWLDAVPLIGPTIRQFRHAQLYRTLGMLVRGGIAVPRALQLGASLLGDADRLRLQRAVQLIYEGRSLSAALQGAELSDPVATSMLTVAERTGALAEILERIAQFHDASLQRSVNLSSRLFEPVLMIFIGLVVGAIVVMMYLPIFDLASSLQ